MNAAEEKAAAEKRKQYAEELRATRAQNAELVEEPREREGLDTLMDKLRAGDSVGGRKGRRTRNGRQSISSAPRLTPQLTGTSVGDTADKAKDMLAALKQDGFNPPGTNGASLLKVALPESQATKPRRSRLRGSLRGDADGSISSLDATSPRTQAPIPEGNEDEDSTVQQVTKPRLDSPASSQGNFPSIASSEAEAISPTKDLPRLPR